MVADVQSQQQQEQHKTTLGLSFSASQSSQRRVHLDVIVERQPHTGELFTSPVCVHHTQGSLPSYCRYDTPAAPVPLSSYSHIHPPHCCVTMARTQDEEFNLQQNNILKLEETLTSLQSNVTASLQHWHSTLRSSHEVAGALRSFFERNECPLSTTSLRYEAVHTNMLDSKYAMLEKLTNDNVLHPLSQFLLQLNDTKRRIKERDTARQAFDHYYTKILKLRAEKETLTLKGKYTGKEVEKVTRNEQKFREAQAAYRTINRSVAGEMWVLWKRRWAVMEELMGEVVKVEVMFVRALANQLDPTLADVRKVTAEQKAKTGGADERDRDGREAPFFSAKPPIGLEEYEEEERRKERVGGKKKAAGGRRDEYDDEDEEDEHRPPVRRTRRAESAFEDEVLEDEDEYEEEQVERKTRPQRRDEVKAAPITVARRRPAATRAQAADDGYDDEYQEAEEEHEQEEVISSADFFAAAAAPTAAPSQPQRRPVNRAPPPPAAAPKRVAPAASAPRRPSPAAAVGDPFAALEAAGNNIDPFFVAAHTSVSASREGAPMPAAVKRKPPAPRVDVDASAVDFFSNAMNVSSSTPVHSAFSTPLAFAESPVAAVPASKPKPLKRQPSASSTFNAGLPPLPATSAVIAMDDPFAGLPLASSPVHLNTAADKPAVVDFFSTPAPAVSSGSATPPSSSPGPASGPPSRRPSLPLHTPSPSPPLRYQPEPAPPSPAPLVSSQPPPPPQPKAVKKKAVAPPPPPVPAADAFEGLDDDDGAEHPPPLLSSVHAAHPPPPPPAAAPAPPMPRQPSQRNTAQPPPPPAAKVAPPPPPSRSQAAQPPPPPYAAAVSSSSPFPPPGPPRASPAPPPPPSSRSSAPPPPPAARTKTAQQPQPRRVAAAPVVYDDDDGGPAFEVPNPAEVGDAKDPFAAFNAD